MKNLKASFEEAFFNSQDIFVHPTAIVGDDVVLSPGAKIGPFAVVVGKVYIGENSRIYPHVSIGFPAEDVNTRTPLGSVHIGKNCEIREFATIGSSKYPTGSTTIGDNCYIMHYCHVAHDSTLENNVILINNVQLGGHTHVEHHAFLMANSATHQGTRIGQYAALAPYSGTRQDLPPFCIMDGQPAGYAGLNIVGLRRAGFSSSNIQALKKITTLFYQQKLTLDRILGMIEADAVLAQDPCVQQFVQFIQQSQRGISRRSTLNTSVAISN